MPFARGSGVLLHPTSLPGPFGIGDLGPAAYQFLDLLAEAGQRYWQVFPLGPTGYGDSPYQCHSAFAGNPLLISLELLRDEGLLRDEDLAAPPEFPRERVDYGPVIDFRRELLERAFVNYRRGLATQLRSGLESFIAELPQQSWLADYVLYAALKEHHDGAVWSAWDESLVRREPAALEAARRELGERIEYHTFVQFLFREQWRRLKEYARRSDITVIGDIPIFVAYDSADAWARRELFEMDTGGACLAVAGVPPDYFSATGQLWGNPLYDWDRLQADGFGWWIDRFAATLELVDAVRLDHFRGFHAYWRVPAGEATAIGGTWAPAPGAALFRKLFEQLGEVPIIAEDLGLITRGVHRLREEFALPGMRILQFAWVDGASGVFQPHRYEPNTAVYTATHDNDTTVGWWSTCPEPERRRVTDYLGGEPDEIHWALTRLALSSVADLCVVPAQDLLGLGSEARMNFPGRPAGNWCWRLRDLSDLAAPGERLLALTELYQRNGLPADDTAEDEF